MRNFGVEQALRVARHAAERPHPYVVGFGMAGDEAGFPAGLLRRRVRDRRARPAWAAPSTRASGRGRRASAAALELPVTRIGHGVRAIEDPELVAELAERGTVLECCPTSNVVLGRLPELRGAPAARSCAPPACGSRSAPTTRPYFGASIGGEYAVARERFGFDEDDLRR